MEVLTRTKQRKLKMKTKATTKKEFEKAQVREMQQTARHPQEIDATRPWCIHDLRWDNSKTRLSRKWSHVEVHLHELFFTRAFGPPANLILLMWWFLVKCTCVCGCAGRGKGKGRGARVVEGTAMLVGQIYLKWTPRTRRGQKATMKIVRRIRPCGLVRAKDTAQTEAFMFSEHVPKPHHFTWATRSSGFS